jgi:hypothetical protein
MDMDVLQRQEEERRKERDRLFKLCDADLSNEPASVQYQRMRYEREIEASFYVKALNDLKMDWESASVWARKRADETVKYMGNK